MKHGISTGAWKPLLRSKVSKPFSTTTMQPLYNLNFLGLPEELRDPDTARFAVLPVPYDATCSYGTGTRHGPAAILTASQQVELYDPELDCEPANAGVITLEPLMPEISGPEAMVDSVREEVGAILDDRKIPLVLGGEHTVTVGAVRAMAEKKALGSILVVDAHADLRESYQGSPYSHASATRRLSELGLPIHVVGARNISRDEMDWYRAQDLVKIHWDHELRDRKISEWTAEIATALQSPVYISIDLDGLDPAIMPPPVLRSREGSHGRL